jgi:hypothetical protein
LNCTTSSSRARELTEGELREHRKAVTRERPSLPHQAGKALVKFEAEVEGHMAQLRALRHAPVRKTKPSETVLVMQSVVNPEPDFSRVVIAMAEHLARQARDDKAA